MVVEQCLRYRRWPVRRDLILAAAGAPFWIAVWIPDGQCLTARRLTDGWWGWTSHTASREQSPAELATVRLLESERLETRSPNSYLRQRRDGVRRARLPSLPSGQADPHSQLTGAASRLDAGPACVRGD
jgi:hypothetical protein